MRAVSKRECMLQYKSMTQEEIDHCVSHSIYVAPDNNSKKGISNETFSFVRSVVSNQADGFTAADIAVSTGLSRITVRKYLDRMCENGMLKTELEYGEIGRPQKLYYNFELHKEK
ncbi:Transcriptional regulatory protein CitT [bioreactor metagenome]|uniref:Transcriptional regulatory protein CitT n=1 Tax=bioreactor metagenome TaxID=1076179 RepID=A0A645FQ20_9ZZZZ